MNRKRVHFEIGGVVQGVGFRPYLHRLAERNRLTGWVRNTQSGIELEVQGREEDVDAFRNQFSTNPPPLAVLEKIVAASLDVIPQEQRFDILPSDSEGRGETFVSTDISICDDCLRELTDPHDRRYRYPFINCTNCGPRYTILHALPYDRENTVMKAFPMCGECEAEYKEPATRRYHAQPDCCPECGPRAFYLDGEGKKVEGDPFFLAQRMLSEGKIVAVKGTGGIHLACNGRDEKAVERLRICKAREEKPLAVMCRSLETAEEFCRVSLREKELLESPCRPIVLLEKKKQGGWFWLSGTNRIGIMLPYTPLHVLLLDGVFDGPDCLVMTSANLPGNPVLLENEEAVGALHGIADGFLLHDRPIENRCDDSLVMEWEGRPYFFRRSRGYAPGPVPLSKDMTGLLALGAEQKASFAFGRGFYAFPSPHIGDLKNLETLDHYQSAMKGYRRLLHMEPCFLVCDEHPDYESTRLAKEWSREKGLPLLQVQHHWAHMASCMADNGLDSRTFGIIWDGTGLGTDRTVWGGEFLEGDFSSFRRVGSIRPISLAGGDRAVKEPCRIAAALLLDAGLPLDRAPLSQREAVSTMLRTGFHCVRASSVGRLFDGVYAVLSGRGEVSYEGQGAALLEAMVQPGTEEQRYPLAFYEEEGIRWFDYRPMIRGIEEDLDHQIPAAAIAGGFMDALCRMALEQCVALNPNRMPVVLSGGVFQNYYLLSKLVRLLREGGFQVFTHKNVSANDEGVCLGQLAIAQRRRENHVFGCSAEDNQD